MSISNKFILLKNVLYLQRRNWKGYAFYLFLFMNKKPSAMIIVHTLNDFLFTLFPEVESGNIEKLKEALLRYYSYGPFVPKIEIKDDAVLVDIDVSAIAAQDGEFQKAVTLCEKGKYDDAKPILMRLIEKNPTNSEFHRIMGQIHSEEGH